ncbi:MAG: 2-amino-4-hydroxy-6-hydroxymethyldihydropteridine diphosphokinase [Oceanospirillaceae bacterium]|nr:2-amino-4-hydroxy-6-hydroxymethyldihydropteridine diphosphokinase [Oceanospirillaceae bacterium]
MILETNSNAVICYLGIGSNLADPLYQVQTAIDRLQQLDQCRWLGVSSLYRSAPVGPPGQDDYINAVACIETSLEPESLLDLLQKLENDQQRVRIERWGARTLDLDLLLFGDQSINTERLNVPHPFMLVRNFVLAPLAEIAPTLILQGIELSKHLQTCPAGELEKLSKHTGLSQ